LKKTKYLFIALLFIAGVVKANPVTEQIAQTVAANFYNQAYKGVNANVTLAYVQFSKDGQADYYVFNVNANDGFVIVAAEDAAHPILGYSNKGKYIVPTEKNNNAAWWMNCRKQEIEYARTKNISATTDIAAEWSGYVSNIVTDKHKAMSFVNPLLSSTWNQSGGGTYGFNYLCPGGSVTGCVATAMAQIMRYWQYPAHGHGYNSYWDQQLYGFQENYGHLVVNFDTSNYNWGAMPLGSSTLEVAELMYDCGVSVGMDYSPTGSGAWVIDGDYPVSAENSYVKYFGYNSATINGVYKSNYTYAAWLALIENELNNNRPVQYVGNDSINNAGHTWVCDGYDVSDNFHMNWGWAGSNNGYFAPNAIFVIGYDFDWWDEAVIGIEPPSVSPYFSGTPTFGCPGLTVHYNDSSISNSPITSYSWSFGVGAVPATSSVSNPTVVYNTPGTYDVTEVVSDINGADTIVRKAYVSVESTAALPVVQNFQLATFPPSGWVNYNPTNSNYTWQLNKAVGGYGTSSQCMYFDNAQAKDYFFTIRVGLWNPPPAKAALDIIGQRQQIYTPEYNFTGIAKPTIYFDVAYAPYDDVFSDTLCIYYSTDCGATFNQVYSKGGMTLGTAGFSVANGADTDNNGVFVPLNNNWRTDTIKIPAIAGASNVMFAFENRSGNGSPIYIDNINIPGAPLGNTNVASTTQSVSLYPNPNNGQFTVAITNIKNPSIKIYNVLGQEVYSQASIERSSVNIDLSAQAKGIYIYRVFSENGSSVSTGRLVIE
jgi:PKD repeat protein